MSRLYWVIGGDYRDSGFRTFIPGTETVRGPFADERKARTEWTRLSGSPGSRSATTRYSIAAEALR